MALRIAGWPYRVAEARATMRMLASMDHRELADIGLIRSDLRDVSALALDCDPTALLADRARERRREAFGQLPPCGGKPPSNELSKSQRARARCGGLCSESAACESHPSLLQ
jgi:uncharacterized protein YjiS (DUF1127 family)